VLGVHGITVQVPVAPVQIELQFVSSIGTVSSKYGTLLRFVASVKNERGEDMDSQSGRCTETSR
jgi:hypothetical protein